MALPWRLRVRAAAMFADRMAARVDATLAALLDVRPMRVWGAELAAELGALWRRSVADARTRAYGPGRVLAVVIRPRPDRNPNPENEERHVG